MNHVAISPLAGKPAPKAMLVDPARLEREYFERGPDLSDPNQLVSFGTSGHRGTPLNGTFTEAHILAITQAICDYRRGLGKMVPSTWEKIPTRCQARRSARRSKFWRPTAWKRSSSATTA